MNVDCVLLVEDNENDALLTKAALFDAGVSSPVHVVSTAEEAFAYLSGVGKYADRTSFPIPKVMFVDLKLPGKSGHEVLRWILRREEFRHVLRVVLTGSDDPMDRKLAYDLGANSYLEKPVTTEQITGPSRNLRMLLATRPTMAAARDAAAVPQDEL